MNDEELIARLRGWAKDIREGSTAIWAMDQDVKQAADRIEALVKERDALKRLSGAQSQMLDAEEARAEQLAATNEALVKELAKAVDFIEDLEGHEWPLDVQAKRILAEIRGANDRRYMHRRYMGQIMAECDCPCEAECLAAERCAALKGDDHD